jgi:hypothetical protein
MRRTLDRYTGRNANFVLVASDRIAVLAARSAAGATGNQPRALPGYQGQSPWLVGLCAAAMIACAGRAAAQPGGHGRETRGGNHVVSTASGCLQHGSTAQWFVLWDMGTAGGDAPGGITLVAPGKVDLSPYIGQQVQVSGVMSRGGGAHQRGAAATRMTVREVQTVAGPCYTAQQPAGSVAGSSAGTNPAPPATGPAPGSATTAPANTTTTSGTSGQTGVSGDALLDGLFNFNIQQLLVSVQLIANVQDTVINVTDVLNDFQIQALLQLLNSNPVASLNATELSLALQRSGVLAPGETVVGVTPPTIRENKTLTETLQQQGILQPGERVVGAKGPRVYKMKS